MSREPRIRWAPKLRPADLVRVYENDAARTVDVELLDRVAWTIYSRLRDVMLVSQSRIECPACGTEFGVAFRGAPPETVSACPSCGWETTADHYHRTWGHQDLNAGCAEFAEYVERFPRTHCARDRMLLIDRVVHAVHRSGNFAARGFLNGTRSEIAAVVDALAGPPSASDEPARQRWRRAKAAYDDGRDGRRRRP